MGYDYNTLPHPDYATHRGMKGHEPLTDAERKQGYVKRGWANRMARLRCCFCPYDSPLDEPGMQLHVFQMHWLKYNAQEAPVEGTRPVEARLFDAAGAQITEMPVAAPAEASPLHIARGAGTLSSPVPPPPIATKTENFHAVVDESRLEAALADMVREGQLTNGANED